MLNALTLLVLCQFTGEANARAAVLPVPGPVMGIWIMRAGLTLRERW